MENEKVENIWSTEEKKNREGKGGDILRRKSRGIFREEEGRRKRGTRQSKHCRFSIYIFDNSKSKSMARLVRAEKMVLFRLVFARKIARMILIQNI